MGSQKSFLRKIMYMVAIAVLLMPLYWLSHPATPASGGQEGLPGGKIAELRKEHRLSEAQLGEIDPASVTIKLATLGMRGVAANILWEKAYDYRMKKDWTNFGATLTQITKVEPNFMQVWSNQGWNLSFNISAEFDDYRQRYRWVVKGLDFLKEGTKYNDRQPRLLNDLGFTTSYKIGRSDEKTEFRKLFFEDKDYHDRLPDDMRAGGACKDFDGRFENWLVGRAWYDKCTKMAVAFGLRVIGHDPLMYHSHGPMCLMYHADAIERDGTFGEVAKAGWAAASRGWHAYGETVIPCGMKSEDQFEPAAIRLNDQELYIKMRDDCSAQIDAMQPGLRQKIYEKKRNALTQVQREAFETPPEKRTPAQVEPAMMAELALRVSDAEVARDVTESKRKEAIKLAQQAEKAQQTAYRTKQFRQNVNFDYWKTRSQWEQTEDMLNARKFVYQGNQDFKNGNLDAAREAYEQGLKYWRIVLDQHPLLAEDDNTNLDLTEMIKRYPHILSRRDEPFPEKFILQDVLNRNTPGSLVPKPSEPKATEGADKATEGADKAGAASEKSASQSSK